MLRWCGFSALAPVALLSFFVLCLQLHALSVLHAPRRLPSRRINSHLTFDGAGAKVTECSLDIDSTLGAALEENHVSVLLTELARLDRGYLALLLEVYFVANDQKREGVDILWLRLCQKDLLPV